MSAEKSAIEASAKSAGADFVAELKALWERLPQKRAAGVLALAWLALFQFWGNATLGYIDTASLFSWMYNAYTAPFSEDGHGLWIPFVVLGLLLWKRRELTALRLEPWPWAFPVFAASVLLHLVGFMAQQSRVSIVALFLGLYAIMGLCWGRAWLQHTFFPYFLFVFCVPIGSLATAVTFPLRLLVTQLAVGFASMVLQVDVVCEGTQIFDPAKSYQYDVAPACSGIRSLVALFGLATVYGFVAYKAAWRRAAMMMAAIPLAVLGNVLRIIIVIVVGDVYGEAAGKSVEQKLGLATFFVIGIVGLMVLSRFLEEKWPTVAEGNEG